MAVLMAAAIPAVAATTVIDGFEPSEGHFALQPSFSGTSAGFVAANSTADLNSTVAFAGTNSQRLFIDDDTAVAAPDGTAWRLRHLSGGGTIANNTSFPTTGYIGYYIRADQGINLQASIIVESATEAERGSFFSIPGDGQWHLVQWNFQNAADWENAPFGTTDGTVTSTAMTIDSLWIRSTMGTGDQDATFFIDNISFTDAGVLPAVPEPSSFALAGLGVAALLILRRRS